MQNASMAVKDLYQEQENELLAFPISRKERKSVDSTATSIRAEQELLHLAEVGEK